MVNDNVNIGCTEEVQNRDLFSAGCRLFFALALLIGTCFRNKKTRNIVQLQMQ